MAGPSTLSVAHRVFVWCIVFVTSAALSAASNSTIQPDVHNTTEVGARPECSTASSNMNEEGKYPLYFLVMGPYPDSPPLNPSWRGGPAVVPAAIVAKDLINAQPDILEDYTIEFLMADSGCNVTTKATNSIVSDVFYCQRVVTQRPVVGIIGPGCSESTISIAHLVTDDQLSLVQIAPTATSPSLNNTMLFPNTFRPIVSALGIVDTYIALIERRNYNHVGALYEIERSFQTTVYTDFHTKLQQAKKKVTSYGLLDTYIPVREFRNETRVIFVFASSGFAVKILCIARHLDMLYPKFQFIFSNRRPKNFNTSVNYTMDGEMFICSSEEMLQTVYGMVFHDFRLARQDKDCPTQAGNVSFNMFSELYEEALDDHLASNGLTEDDVVDTEHHSNYFDATWALALSLNNSLPRLKEMGLSLSDYRYGMPEITKIVRDQLLNVDFEGMRGRVNFSSSTHDGTNVTIIDIEQVLVEYSTDATLVGFYDPLQHEKLELFNNAMLIDAEFDLDYVSPHVSLGIVASFIIVILFVALFLCQVASVVWGRCKSVKAASPNLNHLIFSGCYLSLVGAVIYTNAFVFVDVSTLPKKDLIIPIHCSALQWTGTMTYSLVFGTLCVKRWRIYRIFTEFKALPMKVLHDNVLIMIALFPLVIDVIINFVWSTVDPWYFHNKQDNSSSLTQATCRLNHGIVWTACIAVPKGLLTAVVLYLAIATRRIPRKEFRQTKSINILIYALFTLTGILAPLFYIFQLTVSVATVSVSYFIFCLFEFTFVILCIVLVLLPPLIPPIKDKILRRISTKWG